MCNLDSIMLDYSEMVLLSSRAAAPAPFPPVADCDTFEDVLLALSNELPPSHEYRFPFTASKKNGSTDLVTSEASSRSSKVRICAELS